MRAAGPLGALLVVASWSGRALAYRPFDSTDADVAKTGELEFEIGPAGYLRENQDRFFVAPAIIANAGVLERWELVLEGRNRIRLDPAPGEARDELGDTALSVKGILREGGLQDRTGISVGTEIRTLLPTTEPETGFGASAALIASQRYDWATAHQRRRVPEQDPSSRVVRRAHHRRTIRLAGAAGGRRILRARVRRLDDGIGVAWIHLAGE